MLCGTQHKSDRKWRIDAEERNRHEHDCECRIEAAEPDIVYVIRNEAQYCFGKTRQHQ
jgi:hypothetical protein